MQAIRDKGVMVTETDFDHFYQRELPGQVRRAALLVGSDKTANDIVHEAFVRIYRRWGELESPGSYLNQSVLNGCRDYGRRRKRRREKRHLVAVPDALIGVGQPHHITDALLKLPFNHRAAIVLRFYFEMTTDEIAAELDCAPGSVGPWINRGLDTLRKALT